MSFPQPRAREGGAGNGVLTAIDDFVAGRAGLRLPIVPSFFGVALIWETSMPADEALTELLAAWDRNPHLERPERDRVLHLANTQLQLTAVRKAERRLAEQGEQLARQRELLQQMLDSRAFAAVEPVLRQRDPHLGFSRQAIRRALEGRDETGESS